MNHSGSLQPAMDEMHIQFIKMQPAMANQQGPILFHDTARPHVARVTLQNVTDLGYETFPHPPFSPDLSPTDYHFFSSICPKKILFQRRSQNYIKRFLGMKTFCIL